MADQLHCRIRAFRTRLGLSQTQLADRVGVSRQALGAIEAGRSIPSTALALRLARALDTSVDALFALDDSADIDAVLVEPEARRVVLGRVDGTVVAHRCPDDRPADGLVVRRLAEGGSVRLLDPDASLLNVLVAGCAPLIGLLAGRLGRRHASFRATWVPANSARALDLLDRGLVHLAGLHLAGDGDDGAHLRAAREVLRDRRTTVINLARWDQGLVVAPNNPLGIDAGGLARPELRIVQRDAGSGAQNVLEALMLDLGAPLPPAPQRARNHDEVARLVRWGAADVGVAIRSVALQHGLGFIPLRQERFDLLVPSDRLGEPGVEHLLDLLEQPAFHAEANRLPGYDLSDAGHAVEVC